MFCVVGGEWCNDLPVDSLTKIIIWTPSLNVLAELPGILEDQQDPVHLSTLDTLKVIGKIT